MFFFLDAANNSARLPQRLGPDELPNIGTLGIDGNILNDGIFPHGFSKLSDSIQTLSIARLGLRSMPDFLTTFGNILQLLEYFGNFWRLLASFACFLAFFSSSIVTMSACNLVICQFVRL